MCSVMPPKSRDFSEKCSLQASCSIWAALPGAQHLERCFAPKDRLHMTRRAFLVLIVLIIYNRAAAEIFSNYRSSIRTSPNSYFVIFTRRSQKTYKNQCFFNDSEIHKKSLKNKLAFLYRFTLFDQNPTPFINRRKRSRI